jgi:hypothetical protein
MQMDGVYTMAQHAGLNVKKTYIPRVLCMNWLTYLNKLLIISDTFNAFIPCKCKYIYIPSFLYLNISK